jgi:hypothetical protein
MPEKKLLVPVTQPFVQLALHATQVNDDGEQVSPAGQIAHFPPQPSASPQALPSHCAWQGGLHVNVDVSQTPPPGQPPHLAPQPLSSPHVFPVQFG